MDGEEGARDVVTEVVGVRSDLDIRSDLLYAEFDSDEPMGVRVLGWPDSVFVVAGYDDGERVLTVGEEFTPQQARELASALVEAAEEAEETEPEPEQEDSESLLRRLIGGS